MFTSPEWEANKYASMEVGMRVANIILSNRFWTNVSLALKCFEPLVYVLRRVDGDKIPAMGFLYGDLENAKKEIAISFNHDEKKYRPIWNIIDSRWDAKLKSGLHRAGYYLNPFFYYERREEIESDGSFMDGVIDVMTRFYASEPLIQDKITEQLSLYQHARGSFGREIAKRQRSNPKLNPAKWWSLHGTGTPELRMMAMRVLNLTCSSSGCERAWSTFEMIHSKKRNRLSTKKLESLVFVKFNSRLQTKFAENDRDPLRARDIDSGKCVEWLVGGHHEDDDDDDEEVFPGEGLTWAQVGDASEATTEPRKSSRTKTSRKLNKYQPSSSTSKNSTFLLRAAEEEEELMSSDSSEEEEPNVMMDDDTSSDSGLVFGASVPDDD